MESKIAEFFHSLFHHEPDPPPRWVMPASEGLIFDISHDANQKVDNALADPHPWDNNPNVPVADVRQAAHQLSSALALHNNNGNAGTLSSMAAYMALLLPQDTVEELREALTGPPPEQEVPLGQAADRQAEYELLMNSPRYGPVYQAFVNSEFSGENTAFVRATRPLVRDFEALRTGLAAIRERAVGAVGRGRAGAIVAQDNRPDLDLQAILTRAKVEAQALDQQFVAANSANPINIGDSRQTWTDTLPVFMAANLPDPHQEDNVAILDVADILSPDTMTAMENVLTGPIDEITNLALNDTFNRFRMTSVYKALYPRLMAEAGQGAG